VKYSVVVCSYNKLPYLKRTVESLLAIGGGHEYILSDDGSNDGTVEWASSSGFFTKIVSTGVNDGYRLCTVRNNGVMASSGDVTHVVLLDADCKPESTYFTGHDLVYSECQPESISVGITDNYDEEGIKLIAGDHRSPWLHGKPYCNLHWLSAYGGNISFPMSVFKKVGGFDEKYNGAWGLEDADFVYMCAKQGSQIYLSSGARVRHMKHPPTGTPEMKSGRGPNTSKFKEKHGFSPC
jgi:glycosyltransferase involved in cell wall biosynthesis